MSKDARTVKMARPGEPEAVRTTIVGGRPPAGGANVGDVPRGLEVLIKKAAVDPAFKKLLLEKRAGAADAIGLTLSPAEKAMLAAVPLPQLEGIIAHTRVAPGLRSPFLGYAAGVMLAALGTATLGCNGDGDPGPTTEGIRPDRPGETEERAKEADKDDHAQSEEGLLDDFASVVPAIAAAGGARPDLPDLPEAPDADEGPQEAIQQKKVVKPEDHVTRGIKPGRP
ncbi:MAG TPA: hypothetical protein VMW93_00535 [bacterium]|nr:hypothetical protein [bacterium]